MNLTEMYCVKCGVSGGVTVDSEGNKVSDATPRPGDVSICERCGNVGFYDGEAPGGVRPASKRELLDLTDNTGFVATLLTATVMRLLYDAPGDF